MRKHFAAFSELRFRTYEQIEFDSPVIYIPFITTNVLTFNQYQILSWQKGKDERKY